MVFYCFTDVLGFGFRLGVIIDCFARMDCVVGYVDWRALNFRWDLRVHLDGRFHLGTELVKF